MNPDADKWSVWREASVRPEIHQAIRTLYDKLDADIASRGPTCWQSGKCCDFGNYGHRLYVTALEVAWFLNQNPEGHALTGASEDPDGWKSGVVSLPQMAHLETCPYQVDRICTTHTTRPLGCRIFFCQAGTEAWQQDLYERYLVELRALHEQHGVAYRYADWLALLDEATAP